MTMSGPEEHQPLNSSVPLQRKTTLKWQDNGELSEIDMARIIARLNNSNLSACDLTCEVDDQK